MKEMKVIYKKVEDIIPYENNPRNNEEAIEYVANSIKEFGFKVPIIIDKDNVVVAGHTRLLACESLGIEKVPVIVADDLTEEQIKAFRIADNKVAEKAGWDLDKLKLELEDLDFEMTDFGFGDFELSMLIDDIEPEPFDDDIINDYSEQSENNLKVKRVIVTYANEEEEEYLKSLFKTDSLKVLYKVKELMDENYSD